MTFIEEDKTNKKFFASLEIEMKDDVPIGLNCTHVETLKDYKSYHQYCNPQFISQDKIAFEAWNPLRYSSAEAIFIYKMKNGVIDKLYDAMECLKTDLLFEIKVIDDDMFCIFSDKKMKVYSSKSDQLQLILEQTFDKSKLSRNNTYFNSEIIAVEHIK